jgi:hypothetical protein
MNEIMNQISELVAILRRDKFVLALSAPLASFDAAESVACLQWVTDTCGVAFFKKQKRTRKARESDVDAVRRNHGYQPPPLADLIYEHTA